jgi:orotidine-5'-phosphate decarboxylase
MDFRTRLSTAQTRAGSLLCVGLDPDPERLPEPLRDRPAKQGVRDFCVAITEATAASSCAYKPNLAFFEALGPDGWDVLCDVLAAIPDTHLVVLDGKRGDIGTTAQRYAEALYDRMGADACTVAPYMGRDAIRPFLQRPGRCAFVLALTSNPSAADLQPLDVGGEPLYRRVARLAVEAGEDQPGTVGLVVGATRPEQLAALREAHPETPFLVPGVGAQGGSAEEVLAANAGGPVLVNASRSVLYASPGRDFAEAAAAEAAHLAAALPYRADVPQARSVTK